MSLANSHVTKLLCLPDVPSHMTRAEVMINYRAAAPDRAWRRPAGLSCSARALGTTSPGKAPEVLPTVAAQFSDRHPGSLAYPLCADIADTGGPIAGWPPVELSPTPVAPGGQPVPSPSQQCPAEASPAPPRRFSRPGSWSGNGAQAPAAGSPQHRALLRPRPALLARLADSGRPLAAPCPRGCLPAPYPSCPQMSGRDTTPPHPRNEVNHD
jgi:hypothetical protein